MHGLPMQTCRQEKEGNGSLLPPCYAWWEQAPMDRVFMGYPGG